MTESRISVADVGGWLTQVFADYNDPVERSLRLTEEVLELAQVEGVTRKQAHQLVNQVFNNLPGDRDQELGGVALTLYCYLFVTGQDFMASLVREFGRVNDPAVINRIRRKHWLKSVVSSDAARLCCNCHKPINTVKLEDFLRDCYPAGDLELPDEAYTENEQLLCARKMCMSCFYVLI